MENIKFGHRPHYAAITLLLHYFYTTFEKTKKHGGRIRIPSFQVRPKLLEPRCFPGCTCVLPNLLCQETAWTLNPLDSQTEPSAG